jgi:non-ribosomal peptide synthetase component F
MTLEAYIHQELPFEVIVEQLQLERREKQTPLVQTLFVLQNAPGNAVAVPGITFKPIEEEHISARFDLAVFLHENPQGITGSIVYRTALFKEQTIATLKRRLETILSDIVVRPDTSVDELEIYTEKEKAEQMSNEERLYNTNRKNLRIKKSKTIDLSGLHSSLTKVEKDQ